MSDRTHALIVALAMYIVAPVIVIQAYLVGIFTLVDASVPLPMEFMVLTGVLTVVIGAVCTVIEYVDGAAGALARERKILASHAYRVEEARRAYLAAAEAHEPADRVNDLYDACVAVIDEQATV